MIALKKADILFSFFSGHRRMIAQSLQPDESSIDGGVDRIFIGCGVKCDIEFVDVRFDKTASHPD